MGGPAAPAPMQGESIPAGAGQDEATPEEQALYEQFIASVMDVIYPADKEGEVSPQILDDLQGNLDPEVLKMFESAEPPVSGTPQDAVAVVAVTLLILVDQQQGVGAMMMEGSEGGPDASAVMMESGRSILEELIEVSEAAKIHDFTEEEIEGAVYRAMDLYRTAAETMNLPGFNKEALTAQFNELVEADKQGNLNSILPGLPGGQTMQEG